MKAFMQIAKPHSDIIEGRLQMDVFAADLWQVANGKAPVDYRDKDLFFNKTFITKGLKNILEIAKNRLEAKSGDSVIQLQTPFGGGKTHTLIALYHKAKEWNANVVVFDGTALDPKETIPWEELERQLTGKIEITKGNIAIGKEKLINLITNNSPVLILMDELLQYATKASGIRVGDSNLASQTLAFLQELTGAVSAVGNALLVVTLPSSLLEHYDENAERMFQQLQKITGRMEKIYTPVEENEIEYVINKRLFQSIDEKEAKKIADEFVRHAQTEELLAGDEAIRYREKFLKSYPFRPEVIDVLYKRWGSFPQFQRTRGVLRLLSLVVYDLLNKNIPFIRLGDFNLKNEEIKRELIKHIGPEWDGIIANDITSDGSGAKRANESIGTSYKSYRLGSVVSTTIFMLSFSGRGERGATIREIKLSALYPEFSSTVIDTVINQLKDRLFYLSDEGLYFTNQPNLNKILLEREESVLPNVALEEEKQLVEKLISKKTIFSIYIWPKNHRDIPDSKNFKLIILNQSEPDLNFIEKHGESPRIYRNNLFFLCIDENQRQSFYRFIRKMLALRLIGKDKSLSLTDGQKKEIKNKLKFHEERIYEEFRKYYRKVFIPTRDGLKEMDLGIPTIGEFSSIDSEIYSRLKNEGEILEKISPAVIKEKYLADRDWVETKGLLETFWKTPGEIRIVSAEAFKDSLKEGIQKGLFGLGVIEDETPVCKYFKEKASIELLDNEIIIKPELCVKKEVKEEEEEYKPPPPPPKKEGKKKPEPELPKGYKKLNLRLNVPRGKMADVVRIVNYLNTSFDDIEISIEITAQNGEISPSNYEDKIEEALKQAEINIEEESVE